MKKKFFFSNIFWRENFNVSFLPENPQDADGRCGGGSGLLGLCLMLGLYSSIKKTGNNFSSDQQLTKYALR